MEFLSDTWIAAFDRALAGVGAVVPLAFEQVVTDVPGRGEVRYRVWFEGDRGHAGVDGPPGDVRMTTDYATACALARGEQNGQIALAQGRLRLGGDIEALVRHADALAALADAAADLRASTTYGRARVG
jgi:hypothetical protein